MHDVTYDIVNVKAELLTIWVVPRNRLPLRISNYHDLSVYPVVLTLLKCVGKRDVKPIQSGA